MLWVTFSDEANRGARHSQFAPRELGQARSFRIPGSQKNFLELGSTRCQLLGIRTRKRNRLLIRSQTKMISVLIIRLRSKSEWRFGSAYASLFANRTRTLRCLSSRSCRRNVITLHEHAHKRDRPRGQETAGCPFCHSGKKLLRPPGPPPGGKCAAAGVAVLRLGSRPPCVRPPPAPITDDSLR